MHSHQPTLKLSSRGRSYPHLNLQFPLQCGMYQVVPSSAVIRKMISQGDVTELRTPPICGNLIAEGGNEEMMAKLVHGVLYTQGMDWIAHHFQYGFPPDVRKFISAPLLCFMYLWLGKPNQWRPGIHPNRHTGWSNWRQTWQSPGIQFSPYKFDIMEYLRIFIPFWRNQYQKGNQSGNFKMNAMHSGYKWRNFGLVLSRMTAPGIQRRPLLGQQLLSSSTWTHQLLEMIDGTILMQSQTDFAKCLIFV